MDKKDGSMGVFIAEVDDNDNEIDEGFQSADDAETVIDDDEVPKQSEALVARADVEDVGVKCETYGAAANYEDDIEDGHDHGPTHDPSGCYLMC